MILCPGVWTGIPPRWLSGAQVSSADAFDPQTHDCVQAPWRRRTKHIVVSEDIVFWKCLLNAKT